MAIGYVKCPLVYQIKSLIHILTLSISSSLSFKLRDDLVIDDVSLPISLLPVPTQLVILDSCTDLVSLANNDHVAQKLKSTFTKT